MKLHCAPLSLFLCSIGAAQARVSSHNTVMDVKEDANWSLDNQVGVRIENSHNNRCVDLSGTRISARRCSGVSRWDFRETRRTSIYTIKASGTDNCLGMNSQNRIMVSRCNDTNLRADNQKWTMRNGQIQNTEGNRCMEVDGGQVRLATCSRSNRDQRFTTPGNTRVRDNNIKPVSDRGKCMKVRNSDIESGSCTSSTSWEFDPSTGQLKYNGSNSMCLDATNGVDEAATINRCDNNNSQKWEELSNPNTIRSDFTKQCLKLNDTTKKFNLRDCGTGEQFQFTYERPDAIEVKNSE